MKGKMRRKDVTVTQYSNGAIEIFFEDSGIYEQFSELEAKELLEKLHKILDKSETRGTITIWGEIRKAFKCFLFSLFPYFM